MKKKSAGELRVVLGISRKSSKTLKEILTLQNTQFHKLQEGVNGSGIF